jgi:hypothetical protein
VLAAWYENWFFYPVFAMSTTVTALLYPNGLQSRRWRPVLWLAVGSAAVMVLLAALDPTLELADTGRQVHNPLSPDGMPADPLSSALMPLAWFTGFVVAGGAAVVGIVLRYRRSRGVERLQLRWFAFAVVVVAVVLLLLVLGGALGGEGDSVVVTLLSDLALAFVPLSCGLAILRYHLYDIDRLVSRTTSYALVTAFVITVYATLVTLVPRLLPVSSSLAVAAATLVAAALARPVLSRVQAVVDRRFNRSRVDAQRTVDAFGARLREAVDAQVVRDDLLAATTQMMQPATVTLWVRS